MPVDYCMINTVMTAAATPDVVLLLIEKIHIPWPFSAHLTIMPSGSSYPAAGKASNTSSLAYLRDILTLQPYVKILFTRLITFLFHKISHQPITPMPLCWLDKVREHFNYSRLNGMTFVCQKMKFQMQQGQVRIYSQGVLWVLVSGKLLWRNIRVKGFLVNWPHRILAEDR